MNDLDPQGHFHAPISAEIWDMKYRFKDPFEGTIHDQTVEDTWRRIAVALASVETSVPNYLKGADQDPRDYWAGRFYEALEGFKFLPAGRIIAGAGTGRGKVTLFNCYVMGTIPDGMAGIFDNLKEAALTMQAGGGIGYDFSTLRPAGAPVKGVGADASGPLTFMDVWDAMCRTVMSAGSRRGAMMATMRCDHPDIIRFIEAKQDSTRLRMFNVSVLVTDEFMEAVKNDESWPLTFDGQVYKEIPARELWDKIMHATYAYAEPGVIFIDRINQDNNLSYCENISATNPCLAEGSLVSTPKGLVEVQDVSEEDQIVTVDGVRRVTNVERHKSEKVFRVELSDGSEVLATPAHIFHVARGKFFDTDTRLDSLEVGDKLRLSPGVMPENKSNLMSSRMLPKMGFLAGIAIGDGCMTPRAKTLKIACRNDEPDWIEVVETSLRYFGDTSVTRSTEQVDTVNSRKALKVLDKIGVARGGSNEKTLPMDLLNSNRFFLTGFLDGLVSTDGNVHMSKSNPMIRVTSNSRDCLMQAKRALAFFGILARVYPEASKFPGSQTEIEGRDVTRTGRGYVLVILGSGIKTFYEEIGLSRPSKAKRLKDLVRRYSLTGCTWTASIKSITPVGERPVYDLFEGVTDTWIAEGVVHRGCGEQPLPPYGACLLGSINLAALVSNAYDSNAGIDAQELKKLVGVAVRMMDNVNDVSNFPLEQQRSETQRKRRIGLGITGLADALLMCGLKYGTDEAAERANSWMRLIALNAYQAGIDLAIEKGPFPDLKAAEYVNGNNFAARVLTDEMKAQIMKTGIRNSHYLSIAPTGTISLYAGNISSGVEPIFAAEYNRKVLQKDGSKTEQRVVDYAVAKWEAGEATEDRGKTLPPAYIDAQTLAPADHVKMQAAIQPYIDTSISKTINVPEDADFETFKAVYQTAYEQGCKGCTTYRPNEITGSVISVEKKSEDPRQEISLRELRDAAEHWLTGPNREARKESLRYELEQLGLVRVVEAKTQDQIYTLMDLFEPDLERRVPEPEGSKKTFVDPDPQPLPEAVQRALNGEEPAARPFDTSGHTYKVKLGPDPAFYVTINDIEEDGQRRPFEMFIAAKNPEHMQWTNALALMVSAVFRRPHDSTFIVEELKSVFDPKGGGFWEGKFWNSTVAAIGRVVELHMIRLGYINDPNVPVELSGGTRGRMAPDAPNPKMVRRDSVVTRPVAPLCPSCHGSNLRHENGCETCGDCGHSKCS